MDKDPDFVMQVCKRTKDAVSNHPVLVVGPWRQGKSSLVNSLIWEESKKKKLPEHLSPARTGRRSRVTSKVDLYGPIEDAEVGNIWLADTPGLEPDEQHDIMGGLRHELVRRGVSVAVFTDILVLVIAGTAQGMSTLSSNHFMDWIKDTYAKAREASSLCCTILPVVTHGDQIDADEQSGDIECVMQRLAEIAAVPEGRAVACQAQTLIQEPFIVTNHKLHHSGALLRNGEGKNIGASSRRSGNMCASSAALTSFACSGLITSLKIWRRWSTSSMQSTLMRRPREGFSTAPWNPFWRPTTRSQLTFSRPFRSLHGVCCR